MEDDFVVGTVPWLAELESVDLSADLSVRKLALERRLRSLLKSFKKEGAMTIILSGLSVNTQQSKAIEVVDVAERSLHTSQVVSEALNPAEPQARIFVWELYLAVTTLEVACERKHERVVDGCSERWKPGIMTRPGSTRVGCCETTTTSDEGMKEVGEDGEPSRNSNLMRREGSSVVCSI